ncbi:hypothetical protein Q8F55_008172 [Vanrija albida]|uniref:Uncharacterized protein n=1 Tax=Vanrija albida TaxID=181172 RepID=A0ABR3PWJ3_9TREE
MLTTAAAITGAAAGAAAGAAMAVAISSLAANASAIQQYQREYEYDIDPRVVPHLPAAVRRAQDVNVCLLLYAGEAFAEYPVSVIRSYVDHKIIKGRRMGDILRKLEALEAGHPRYARAFATVRFFRGFGPSHVLPMLWPPVVPGAIPSWGDTRAVDSARTVSAAAPILHLGVRVHDPPPARRRSRSLGRRAGGTMTLAAALRATHPDEMDALDSPVSPASPPPSPPRPREEPAPPRHGHRRAATITFPLATGHARTPSAAAEARSVTADRVPPPAYSSLDRERWEAGGERRRMSRWAASILAPFD